MVAKPIVSKHAPNLDAVVNVMSNNPGKRFTSKDLLKYVTCKPGSVYIYIRAAVSYYPDNVKKEQIKGGGANGTFVAYYWDDTIPMPSEEVKEEPDVKTSKNGEGYPDKTAHKAIEICEKPSPIVFAAKDGHSPLPGDIWLTTTYGKADEYFLVLANCNANTVTGLRLSKKTPTVTKLISKPFDFSIVMNNGDVMITDASMVTYKWRKYMTKLADAINENDLNILKSKIQLSLGITEATRIEYVEQPVYKEKIVEKRVEVPVEKIVYVDKPVETETPKIPEGCISEKDAEFAMLVQERNIWKSVAENLMKRI